MLRFLADEDFDHNILRGLLLQTPSLDILTIQESGRLGEDIGCVFVHVNTERCQAA